LPGFFFASLIGRGARFFLVAALIVAGGDKLEMSLSRYVERIGWIVVVLAALVIIYFAVRH
jgi:membrane protein DedA with SNARE-associated domain